jgi:hypothetical protein
VIDIVITLVFSIVMLLFMAYPAIKIVEYIDVKRPLSQKNKNILVVVTTILLSLIVGIFLRYY